MLKSDWITLEKYKIKTNKQRNKQTNKNKKNTCVISRLNYSKQYCYLRLSS